jgi:hypothetical protein
MSKIDTKPRQYRLSKKPRRAPPSSTTRLKGRPKKVRKEEGGRRRITRYPTQYPHEPYDSKTKEIVEDSEEPPKWDKLGILHLIRYKTTKKPTVFDAATTKRTLRKLFRGGSSIEDGPDSDDAHGGPENRDESFEHLKNMNVSRERLDRIMRVANLRNRGLYAHNLNLNETTSDQSPNPNFAFYMLSTLFVVYAVVLFLLFKYKIFRR